MIHPAIKYMNEFVNNPDRAAPIDESRIPQVKEIIELICQNEHAEECGTCTMECEEVCCLMAFLIRSMLWSCEHYNASTAYENFKDVLHGNVLGDFS